MVLIKPKAKLTFLWEYEDLVSFGYVEMEEG